jgi:divalent metal cation (Fe/Co/Zn/Cd) transporter
VVVWELKGINQQGERRALRFIGGAFIVLAIYILVQAGYTLLAGSHPHHSPLGIAWLAATLVAMLLLAWDKGRTGKALGHAVLLTESRVTLVDAYLAGAVLVGLILNAAVGWWWADPVASLVIVYYGLREGLAAWHGEH